VSAEPKNAIVTGASRGIGRTVTEQLLKDGFQVAAIARSADKLEELQNQGALAYPLDVTDEQALDDAVGDIFQRFGQIDLVFNNAGINRGGTTEISYEDFDEQIRTNVRGAFNVLKSVTPRLKNQGSGYIVNLASIASKIGFEGAGAYCASKFALLGLNESLHRELAPLGIKVTAICPSWVNTAMAAHGPVPKEDMIQTEEIYKTIRYLMSLSPACAVKELVLGCSSDIQ